MIVRAPKLYPYSKIERFVNDHDLWINNAIEMQKDKKDKIDSLSKEDIEVMKNKLKEYLPERIAYYAGLMGVTPAGYKVTSARKRFGSCSGKNSLCFSYLLMLYPKEAVDYVIVHELAHIKFHNHSKDFYDFVSKVMPDYKDRENILKKSS